MFARARARENTKNSGDSGDIIYKSMFIKVIVIKNRYFRVGTEWGQSGDRLKIYGFGTTKGGGVRSFWAEFLDRYAQAHIFIAAIFGKGGSKIAAHSAHISHDVLFFASRMSQRCLCLLSRQYQSASLPTCKTWL